MPRIPLIEDLTAGPVPAGSNLLVEFDAASQWYLAAATIAVGWMKTDGTVIYAADGQSPQTIRTQLNRLGLTTDELEKSDKLQIHDWYTSTLGLKSKEKFAVPSLKVADLSIDWSKLMKESSERPDLLRIVDNASVMSRFNEEKAWVELELTRTFPRSLMQKSTLILGLIREFHSDQTYKALEAAADGVIDLKVEELGKTTINLMRIRNLRNVVFSSEWRKLNVAEENFEVTLEK